MNTCAHCGSSLSGQQRKYCSRTCSNRATSDVRAAAHRTSANPRKGRTCVQCGRTYDAGNTEQVVCSRACQYARTAEQRPGPTSRVYFPECKGCGRTFASQWSATRWCSYRCRVDDCGDRVNALYALACDIKRPGEAHKWRAILIGYLIERDGNRCAMCRKRLDPSLPSGPRGDRMGISIDHVVPRSQGGSDDLANLRLMHWGENQQRGNRGGFEQLALIG
jgi:5-methylcytosine-specific restriction endonuclease McrA